MPLSILENDLTVAAAAISGLLLVRLVQLRFYRQFPWIVSYEFLQFLPMTGAVVLGTSSLLYARFFEYWCLPSLVAALFVAHELVTCLYVKHPGLRIINQRSVRFGIAMAIVAAIPSVYSTHARWHDPEFACMLWTWMEAMRVTEIGIVVYLASIYIACKKRKIRLSRNLALLGIALLSTFISDAIASTMLSALRLHGTAVYVVNIISVATTVLANAILVLFLQLEPTSKPIPVSLDQNLSARLSALQQVVTTCTRNLLR